MNPSILKRLLLLTGMLAGICGGQVQLLAAPFPVNADSGRLILRMPEDSMRPLWTLAERLMQQPLPESMAFINALQEHSLPQNSYDLKLEWLRARCLINRHIAQYADSALYLAGKAIPLARIIQAPHLLVEWSQLAGSILRVSGKKGECLLYLLEAVRVSEKIGYRNFPYPYHWYGDISLALFDLGEYKACVRYYNQAFRLVEKEARHTWMNGLNTIGVCYKRLGMFDSARHYFEQAAAIARQLNNPLWKAIIAGNRGQLYFEAGQYDSARLLIAQDYTVNRQWNEWSNVANAAQWLAQVDLAENKPREALPKVREALRLLQHYPRSDYLEYTLKTAAHVFMVLGQTDSAQSYLDRYYRLHDSLMLAGRPDLVELAIRQIDRENASLATQQLQQQLLTDRLWRNGLIALVFVLGAATIWIQLINRRTMEAGRLLTLSKEAAAAADMEAARQKLALFTQTVLEKNAAIAGMEVELAKMQGLPDQATVKQLSEGSLLTDEDWKKFRELFEVPYPGFLHRLRHHYPSITPSEIRMAALVRLQLSAKEMASILGISTISIYKSRQRLRQRVAADSDEQLETLLEDL